jgi:transcriptional regulator with XRE-family HTH domain
MTGPGASTVDAHVAKRLRLLRQERQVTQMQLAASLGVSTQLIHKYEAGRTRISPGRLYLCSRLLDVPVEYFFAPLEGIEGPIPLLPRRSAGAPLRATPVWQASAGGHD